MLQNLTISNYALIDAVSIDFDGGFNIITGETGAGKSIILGALGILVGDRADLSAVRDVNRKSVVEGVFDISQNECFDRFLSQNQIESNRTTCIIRREISSKYGSRAFINDTPVTLPVLRQAGNLLIDIHTQHQNLKLTDNSYQLEVIDLLADNNELLSQYSKLYGIYRRSLDKYKKTKLMLERTRNDREYLAFQSEQLEQLNIKAGEQTDLEQEREILANAAFITRNIVQAREVLDGETGAHEKIDLAIDALRDLANIMPDANEWADRLNSARIEISDIIDSINKVQSSMPSDESQLAAVEERLASIYSMQARHHVDTDNALVQLGQKLKQQLQEIDGGDDLLEQLEEDARKAKKDAVLCARQLTARREAAAKLLTQDLTDKARSLGMANFRCEVSLEPERLSATGADRIDYLVAFNKNQTLVPIGKSASGGEISRIALSLKNIVCEKIKLQTMIFDEIDTGVSGEVATRMARMMNDIARHTQVIAITHLPAVAAYGKSHFKVYKEDDDNKTTTRLEVLQYAERVAELAVMLSGSATDPDALSAAAAMLSRVN